jgi:hypothetical protein
MSKRTIKPAAGDSRVSLREANSAARLVYREGTSGRFIVVDRDGHSVRQGVSKVSGTIPTGGVKDRKVSGSTLRSSRESSKKR